VVCQYLFGEASGNIFDEVADVEMTVVLGGGGGAVVNYNQTLAAPHTGLSPGIKFTHVDAYVTAPGWTVGASDSVVMENWIAFDPASTFIVASYFFQYLGEYDLFLFDYTHWCQAKVHDLGSGPVVQVYAGNVSTSTVIFTATPPTGYNDGNPHFWRFVIDNGTGNVTVEFDGAPVTGSQTGTWTGHGAMAFTGGQAAFGTGLDSPTTYYDFRLSIGTGVTGNNSLLGGYHVATPTRF
jgi:hypothetical protein